MPTWLIIARESVSLASDLAPIVLDFIKALKTDPDKAQAHADWAVQVARQKAAGKSGWLASKNPRH